MLPTLVLFAFFVWGPLIENILYSFYSIKRFERQQFVWFDNYARVFTDPAFLKALWNTFVYVFWSLLIGFLLPLFLGLLLYFFLCSPKSYTSRRDSDACCICPVSYRA